METITYKVGALTVRTKQVSYSECLAEFSVSGDYMHAGDGAFWYADVYFTDTGRSAVLTRNFPFGIMPSVVRDYVAALVLAAEIAETGIDWKPKDE